MGKISIDMKCDNCGEYYVNTLDRGEATYENRWHCIECGHKESVRRIPSAPAVMKASYPMGTKRKGFAELKEANDIMTELSGLSSEDREKAQTEIDRLEGRRPAPKKFK